MPVRIGYACINTVLQSPNRTCRLSNATPDRIIELGRQNLNTLLEILRWNQTHDIRLFRISSETIPFASHPVNEVPWWEVLQPELDAVGGTVREGGMRVSMHPGQFTVLNSPRPEVVENSIAELAYHARFLDSLGVDARHKIILHIGGVYGDKESSLQRFAEKYARLPENVRRRLVVENDEKSYSLADALKLAGDTGAPVVFDVFHHVWNPSFPQETVRGLAALAGETWRPEDGPPKLHYSDQWQGKPAGSHSQSIDVDAFGEFYAQVQDLRLDVMLEVKDKEQSVLALYRKYPELRSPA